MIFATAAPFWPTRLFSSRDPAIPNHTDNEQNRKALVFARAPCRLHMNASTSSFPLIHWTHRERISTSHSCHLIVKNRVATPCGEPDVFHCTRLWIGAWLTSIIPMLRHETLWHYC